MNSCIIYKFIFSNGKTYIGQTNDYYRRMRQYKCYSHNENHKYYNLLIYKAIRKCGWDNVKREIICTVSEEFVDDTERYFIEKYNSLVENGYGYNIEDGGKLNKCAVWKGKKRPEHSKRMMGKGNPNYGKKFSDEHRKNLSESLMGNPSPMAGKILSDETKNKISNTLKGYKHSNYTKLKMGISRHKSVFQIDVLSTKIIKKYDSIGIASVETNTDRTSISKCLHNKANTAGGYVWRYA